MAVSEIGVSRTRSPKRSRRPRVRPKTLPPSPTSMPATNTRSSVGQLDLQRRPDGVHGAEHGWRRSARRRLGDRRAGPHARSRRATPPAAQPWPGPRSTAASSSSLTRLLERRRRRSGASGSCSPPLGQLLGRPVALGVALVVAVPPIGLGLDDDRAAAGPHPVDRPTPSPSPRPRRRCRRRRRGRSRSRRPARPATRRAGWRPGRTRRSRCSRRRTRPGSRHTAARFGRLVERPAAVAPSPKKATATSPDPAAGRRRRRRRRSGTPAATMPLAPKIPIDGSAMCIDPPRPRLVPPSFAISSANIADGVEAAWPGSGRGPGGWR